MTKLKMAHPMIRPIDQDSIQVIAAGSKISDLETVVRELVENSIDAAAKVIDIKLSKFGYESVEVEDNGTGIEEVNFDTLGQRYHTSKILDFAKLSDSLQTFGFRGEALSCLCNIADVTIITKTKFSATGTKLIWKNGQLAKREPAARCVGTTVIIKDLFRSLPVRRRELEATAKRQYDKVCRLIYEYALARPMIRFSLTKKASNSNKMEKDFTHGKTTLEGVITTIFSAKMLNTLIPIKQDSMFGKVLLEPKIESDQIKSETDSGSNEPGGPSNVDQTDTPSSTGQSLEVQADIGESNNSIARSGTSFETSVAPDRETFFRFRKSKYAREKPIYTIHGYISHIDSGRSSGDAQFIFVNKKPCDIPKVSRAINEIFHRYTKDKYPTYFLFVDVQTWAADFNVPNKRTVILQDENKLIEIVKDSIESMYSSFKPASQKECPNAQIPVCTIKQRIHLPEQNPSKRDHDGEGEPPFKKPSVASDRDDSQPATYIPRFEPPPVIRITPPSLKAHKRSFEADEPNEVPLALPALAPGPEESPSATVPEPIITTAAELLRDQFNEDFDLDKIASCTWTSTIQSTDGDGNMKVSTGPSDDLAIVLQRERLQRCEIMDSKQFSFAINPKFNAVAEQELKLNLSKDSFKNMQILGQFNRGFIITKLNKHLFIIDQHATDERANFEDQIAQNPYKKQEMVHHQSLFLNSIQENTVMNNLELMSSKGFGFRIDRERIAGLRVLMTHTSICQRENSTESLNKSDLEELLNVVMNAPQQAKSYTLKKVKDTCASIACRKSVMIGDQLTWQQMEEIVYKMAKLSNPWVCAHDRPTIRHLMEIDWVGQE